MSTFFLGEGNIGSAPEFQEFNSGSEEPRRLLRLNVYFDNPIPRDGGYEDRGGYWAPVELWHREAEHWSTLYQKGMRILVEGRTARDEWEDSEDNMRVTFKIEARRIGVLPHRVQSIAMKEKPSESSDSEQRPSTAKGGKKSSRRQPQQTSMDVDG
ncbi:single-stranded DNA-binding protein [Pseudomonas sp. GD03721]|nr:MULTISPECIES: single-stranded DNA-binding protein [unclassified Pseudomonas]MDH1440362.1 single-stranded DNA-binding protein [Pseudomonas sp. GD03722]WGG03548.1 single-stranded DNA-binding protein [Pseudomonas sp. GD03721]WGG07716.1 single-stranded DNA-binding protein [Pseudomonas sp. GD03919]